jgi:predicted HAD superfamily Cof-like phosphohydrolase
MPIEEDSRDKLIAEQAKTIAEQKQRIQELLETNTRLVVELRRTDRKRMVREFHSVMGQAIGARPKVPSDTVVRNRVRFMGEEFVELVEAAYGDYKVEPWRLQTMKEAIYFVIENFPVQVKMVPFIDATIDIDYFSEGTRIEFGVNSTPLYGPKRESDGKRLKPVDWTPPDILGELIKQGFIPVPNDPKIR